MTKMAKTTVLLILCCVVNVVSASAQTREVDLAFERTTGDKMRGPATIRFINMNILRYDIQFGTTVTFTNGPDLKLPFIPPIPTQAAQAGPNVGSTAVTQDPISAIFQGIVADLDTADTRRVNQIQTPIIDAVQAVTAAKDSLEGLVFASDSILRTRGGAQTIINRLSPILTSIDLALTKAWPDVAIVQILGELDMIRGRLLTLPATPVGAGQVTWAQWYTGGNKLAYDSQLARISELQALIRGLDRTSPQAVAFRESQSKLNQWKPILIGVREGGPEGFTHTIHVGCGFGFNQTKSSKIEVIKRDRLAAPGASEVREEVVTVECSSPLSVSAGFGFSSVEEREFVFVQSTKPVTANGQTTQMVINRFGFKNRSSFRPLPVLLLNTRFYEPNDTFALHASAGAAVDIKTGQAGTDVEFIVGPSFSFKRTLFITPGLHIGRVPTLVGGFAIGDEVPMGVSAPPVEKAWRKGFVTTFTYRIR